MSPDSQTTPYPAEELVLSEKGSGTQTYVYEGGIETDQIITIATAVTNCSPGEKISIRTNPSLYNVTNLGCESMPITLYRDTPPTAAVPALEVTVETSAGASFWVQARVHSDGPAAAGQ